MPAMGDLANQVIVITGASAGIGEAFARLAHARGAKLVLAARREAELAALASALPGSLAVVTDVGVRADNEQLRDRAIAAFGRVDCMVANAGRGISRSVLQLTDDDLDDMVRINVKSLVYAIQTFVPHFTARGTGQLIYVSSGLARVSMAPFRSAYSAAKAAASSLMSTLRLELAAKHPHVHASTIFPGVVATGFGSAALHGGPDSRGLPNAQPVGEVAELLAELVVHPRAELYTRPQLKELVGRFYSAEDVATAEAPFVVR